MKCSIQDMENFCHYFNSIISGDLSTRNVATLQKINAILLGQGRVGVQEKSVVHLNSTALRLLLHYRSSRRVHEASYSIIKKRPQGGNLIFRSKQSCKMT
jgi:ABC-type transporter Mla MlaB component